MSMVIGIDPGISGGIAFIGNEVIAYKMPETERDVFDLLDGIFEGCGEAPTVFLEKVHTMKGQGIASSGKFMQGYGFLRGILIALKYPLHDVSPIKWQRTLGCLTKGDKNVTKQMAQQLFPQIKVTHSIADALLIAYFGKLFLEENVKI